MAVEDIGDVGVDVVTDFSGFEAQLRRIMERLERQLHLDIPVDVDTRRASAQMTRWRRLNERAVDIAVKISQKSLAKVSSQLAAITGVSALTQAFTNFNDHIQELYTNILPIAKKISLIGAAAGPAATLIGSVVVGVTDLGEKLGKGSIAGLLALPGLLVAAGAASFVFTTAFKDAPDVLGDSLMQYQNFRETIGKPFWEKAKQPMKDMLDNMFPAINAGFGKMGESAGGFTAKLADSFKNVMTPARIEGIFGNWSKGLDILGDKAAGPLASITSNLIDWGSTLIPKIADKVGDLAIKFDAWLDNAIKTGELDKALDDLFKIIEDVWAISKDVWSIFQSIAKAAEAAGIGAFPLKDIMDKIATTMASPAFQEGLTTFFEGAKRGWEGLKPAFSEFGDTIVAWNPMISKFMGDAGEKVGGFFTTLFEKAQDPTFMANIGKALDGFLKIWDNLEPAIGPFMDKIGEIAAFAGILADEVSKTLGVGIEKLAPVFGDILEKLGPLVKVLGEHMRNMLEDIDWEQVGQSIGILIEGVTAFVEALNSPVVRFVIKLILDFITTAIAGFGNLLGGVMRIVGGLLKLLSGDWSGLNDIWEGVKAALLGIWDLFITLFAPAKILGFLGKLAKPLLEFLGPALKGLGDLFKPLLEGFGKFMGEVVSNIPSFLGKLVEPITKWIGDNAGKFGQWLVDGFVKGAQAVIGGFLAFVWEPIVQAFKDFFGIASPSTLFEQFGKWLIEGLMNGIKALIDGVVALFTPIVEGIQNGWNGLVSGITDLWNGFVGFLSDGWNMILAVASTVWNGILAVASAVWAGIMAVIGAVWNFIQAGFNMVLSVATTVWNTIQMVAAAVWAAIQAAVAAAIAAIQAVIQGIVDWFVGAWNTLISIAQGVWDGIVAGATGVYNGVMGAIGGIIDGVAGIFNGVKDTIMGIWNSIQLPNILGGLGIPGFAGGVTDFGGGLAVVGERGPELVRLPKGADVIPSSTSQGLLNQASAPTVQPTGEGGDKGFVFAPTIYNPKQETTEQSLFKSAQTLSYLGLVG